MTFDLREAAQAAYDRYDFGDEFDVEGASAWSVETGMATTAPDGAAVQGRCRRKVFVRQAVADPDADTEVLTLNVEFDQHGYLKHAQAYDNAGNPIGDLPPLPVSPPGL